MQLWLVFNFFAVEGCGCLFVGGVEGYEEFVWARLAQVDEGVFVGLGIEGGELAFCAQRDILVAQGG